MRVEHEQPWIIILEIMNPSMNQENCWMENWKYMFWRSGWCEINETTKKKKVFTWSELSAYKYQMPNHANNLLIDIDKSIKKNNEELIFPIPRAVFLKSAHFLRLFSHLANDLWKKLVLFPFELSFQSVSLFFFCCDALTIIVCFVWWKSAKGNRKMRLYDNLSAVPLANRLCSLP